MTAPLDMEALRKIVEAATPGPWAWESTGEKCNEFVIGLAYNIDGTPVDGEVTIPFDEENGQFMDDEILRRGEIGANEGVHVNYADAAFICAARTAMPILLAELDRLRTREAELLTANTERVNEVRAAQTTIATLQEQVRALRAENEIQSCGERKLQQELACVYAANKRLRAAITWALGEGDSDFRLREEGEGPYYWRTELRKRATPDAASEASNV